MNTTATWFSKLEPSRLTSTLVEYRKQLDSDLRGGTDDETWEAERAAVDFLLSECATVDFASLSNNPFFPWFQTNFRSRKDYLLLFLSIAQWNRSAAHGKFLLLLELELRWSIFLSDAYLLGRGLQLERGVASSAAVMVVHAIRHVQQADGHPHPGAMGYKSKRKTLADALKKVNAAVQTLRKLWRLADITNKTLRTEAAMERVRTWPEYTAKADEIHGKTAQFTQRFLQMHAELQVLTDKYEMCLRNTAILTTMQNCLKCDAELFQIPEHNPAGPPGPCVPVMNFIETVCSELRPLQEALHTLRTALQAEADGSLLNSLNIIFDYYGIDDAFEAIRQWEVARGHLNQTAGSDFENDMFRDQLLLLSERVLLPDCLRAAPALTKDDARTWVRWCLDRGWKDSADSDVAPSITSAGSAALPAYRILRNVKVTCRLELDKGTPSPKPYLLGELDGVVVDDSGGSPVVLYVLEVKLNMGDVSSKAVKQRDRLFSALDAAAVYAAAHPGEDPALTLAGNGSRSGGDSVTAPMPLNESNFGLFLDKSSRLTRWLHVTSFHKATPAPSLNHLRRLPATSDTLYLFEEAVAEMQASAVRDAYQAFSKHFTPNVLGMKLSQRNEYLNTLASNPPPRRAAAAAPAVMSLVTDMARHSLLFNREDVHSSRRWFCLPLRVDFSKLGEERAALPDSVRDDPRQVLFAIHAGTIAMPTGEFYSPIDMESDALRRLRISDDELSRVANSLCSRIGRGGKKGARTFSFADVVKELCDAGTLRSLLIIACEEA